MNKFLEIENVYKQYGDLIVLDNVNLSVGRGELVTVVGPSGCGKSTLLRLILGAEQPTRGDLSMDGEAVGHPDPDRGIVFQKYGLYPHRTVIDNVMLGPLLGEGWFCPKQRKEEIRELAQETLKRVRLSGHDDKYPHQLSGGMRQRVAIAQSLIMRPKLLLMDEPFGALDPDTREDMQMFLLEQWEETATTIFFVTHDLEEALFLGTRVLALSQYYEDDRGPDCAERGAKIVYDLQLERKVASTEIKRDAAFRDSIQHIREQAFAPEIRQHVTEFNLSHPRSFQKLTVEEHNAE